MLITMYPCFFNLNIPTPCKEMISGTVQVLGTGLEPNMINGYMSALLLSCACTGMLTCRWPISGVLTDGNRHSKILRTGCPVPNWCIVP
jgi:hypothetical protein